MYIWLLLILLGSNSILMSIYLLFFLNFNYKYFYNFYLVDNETYGLNVISEWNLTCTDQFLASIVQSLYLVGSLCAFVTELVVNKYGRRKASVIFILSLITITFISQSMISDMKMLSVNVRIRQIPYFFE